MILDVFVYAKHAGEQKQQHYNWFCVMHVHLDDLLKENKHTCGKRGLSSFDFLIQSATSLFMALGQLL